MRCGDCGEQMKPVQATIPYPESGLDNVVLVNVPVWRCPNGHEEYEIPAVQQLHDVLAEAIVEKPAPLVGREVRYLRKHLGLSAKDFAGYLGINAVSLSRIENAKRAVTTTLDRLARFLYAQLAAAHACQPCVKSLVQVLGSLREGAFPLPDHRIEHLDTAWRTPAGTRTEWREIRP
jgi:YgiT-type zinc finger domain-containing protein